MSKRETKPFFAGSAAFAIIAGLITTAWVTQAFAQDTSSEPMEEIVVTGSFIKRPLQKNHSSPIDIIGSEDIQRIGRTDIGALLAASPANSGSFVNRDTGSSGLQSAANVNLRGLGASSTLVLLNGRRQTQGGIPNRAGEVFVDVNGLVPLIMVDRVEVVQDGTSALYGSDAIAGVVNFVTRDSFEGAEVQLEYRNAADGDGQIMTYSGIVGAGNDRGHLVAAVEYVDQNSIANEARFSDERLTTGGFNSFFGTPATYKLIPGNTYNAPYDTKKGFIADPLCGAAAIGGLRAGLPGAATPGDSGVCRLGLALGGQLYPEEKRLNTLVRGHIDISDSTEAFGEFGFSQIRTHRTDSPSYGFSNAPIIVPANNPGNFFGDAVQIYTRPVGVNSSRPRILTESDTFRVLAGLRGDLAFSDWTYELSALHSENDQFNTDNDQLINRFIDAVSGKGGPNGNEFFNPFGNQYTASPGSSKYNSPEVLADFMIERFRKTTASLDSIDGVITGNLDQGILAGGAIGVALGFNFRKESLEGDYDEASKKPNTLAFHAIEIPFAGTRNVSAMFAEVLLPLQDNLEVTGAIRYENYGNSVDTIDYKIGTLWQPTDNVSIRGSFGTSFRAPSLFEAFGGLTANISVPTEGGNQAALQVVRGNPNVKPEESDNFNIGATWAPVENWTLGVDYWSFDYTNVLAVLSGITIYLDDPTDSRIKYDTSTGEIRRVFTSFTNLSSLKTDGIDISSNYSYETGVGLFDVDVQATYITRYDLKALPANATTDGVGSRNFTNFGAPMPELRANLRLGWSKDNHSADLTYRYIGVVEDDVPKSISEKSDFNTIDLLYSYQLDDSNTVWRAAIYNATDTKAPLMGGSINTYDGRIHDARGTLFSLGLTHRF